MSNAPNGPAIAPDDSVDVRFTYSVVASALHDANAVDELTAPIQSSMNELGGCRTQVGERATPDGGRPHVLLVATGGTEHALLDEAAFRRNPVRGQPVLLIAHGAHNSLPAALETLGALQQAGRRGRIVYLSGDESDRRALDEAISDLEAIVRLHNTRLGLIGGSSSWLVASTPDIAVVERRWGPHLEIVDSNRLVELTRSVPVELATTSASRFTSTAEEAATTVTTRDVVDASAITTAMQHLIASDELDAVSVRCFDLLDDPGTSGCLALATLNDDGVVAGCEGDLPSTLAMLLVRHLLGQPAWMANPAQVDVAGNRLVLAHCTVAPSMVNGFALSTHFESGKGVGVSGRFEEQPVTLLRIGGRDLDKHWVAEGRIIGTGDDPDLCRTQVTIELDVGSVSELLDRPLGNHLVLALGCHAERLDRWMDLAIADSPAPCRGRDARAD